MAYKNVFLALGFAHDEATIETWRSDLARIVRRQFERSGKSQVSFAQQLGIKQSVLSPIVNGNLGRVSVEFLLKLCVRLGTAGEARWSGSAEAAVATEVAAKGAIRRRAMTNATHRVAKATTRGRRHAVAG
jgi:predicted XRE-type DNA-binding protein